MAAASGSSSRTRTRRRAAAAGSVLFFVLVPCVVGGLIPALITGWDVRYASAGWIAAQIAGLALVAAGALGLVRAFVRFAVDGVGTPAPVAPTERLVVSGEYRFVRNPMYLAVDAAIVGQALVFGQPGLLLYAAAFALVTAAFVRWHEEPVLQRRFGAQYEAYRRDVPAWVPRLTPWTPPAAGAEPGGGSGREAWE